jgi:hypothetical protein
LVTQIDDLDPLVEFVTDGGKIRFVVFRRSDDPAGPGRAEPTEIDLSHKYGMLYRESAIDR